MPFSGGDSTAAAALAYGGTLRPVVLAALGDSQVANCFYNGSTTSRGFYSNGFLGEMRAALGSRALLPIEHCFGYPGAAATTIAGNINNVLNLALKPQACIVYVGTNPDSVNDLAAFGSIIKKLSEAGILPILLAVQTRTFSGSNAGNRAHQGDINTRLRSAAMGSPVHIAALGLTAAHTFVYVDPSRYITDYASTTGDPLPGMLADGLHFGPPGAYFVGRELANTISGLFNLFPMPVAADINDVYIAGAPGAPGTAPFGSLTAGTLMVMQGTGGTVQTDISPGSTVTNNGLATGLSYQRYSGNSTSAVTLSKVPKADAASGTRQRIDIAISALAGTSPQSLDLYRFSAAAPPAAANLAAGDYIYSECEVEVLTAPTMLKSIELTLDVGNGGTTDGKQGGGNLPSVAQKRTLRTPPYLVAASANKSATLNIWVDASVAGAAVSVAFDKWQTRKCGPFG